MKKIAQKYDNTAKHHSKPLTSRILNRVTNIVATELPTFSNSRKEKENYSTNRKESTPINPSKQSGHSLSNAQTEKFYNMSSVSPQPKPKLPTAQPLKSANVSFISSGRKNRVDDKSESFIQDYSIINEKSRNSPLENESVDDIANEMRSLSVAPTEMVPEGLANLSMSNICFVILDLKSRRLMHDADVQPVDTKTKYKILNWLESIGLIKESAVDVDEFPSYCRNGVMFFDLINRMEGVWWE